jgi:hypothetical protein
VVVVEASSTVVVVNSSSSGTSSGGGHRWCVVRSVSTSTVLVLVQYSHYCEYFPG